MPRRARPRTTSTNRRSRPAWSLVDALVESGLMKSKGAARRAIQQGGVYVNGDRIGSESTTSSTPTHCEDGSIRLRHGKKHHMVLRVAES